MAKRIDELFKSFQPEKYDLNISQEQVKIFGNKIGSPSKRITLHQKGLKIISAEIVRADKRGPIVHEISRINHLPSMQQVRLHTKELLYPGSYQIVLRYRLSQDKVQQLSKLGNNKPNRELLPSVDEQEAWAVASYTVNWPSL